jgi:hypothetical protein
VCRAKGFVMKKLPIGISDYKEVIEKNYYYVDKTLLIYELLSHADKVTLICRPRRFGKTINLSMLKYFFEQITKSNEHLFVDKKIWQHEDMRIHQGQYPVIFISFKDAKGETFAECYSEIMDLIAEEFERHQPILMPTLDEINKQKYQEIINRTGSSVRFSSALGFLSKLLKNHYQKNVMVFLDEYDSPIHDAFDKKYYKKMVDFLRKLYGKVLKDNKSLEKAVLTGILRTAKEGIFSGLNNVEVCTWLRNDYADKFGFTQSEVEQVLHDSDITSCTLNDITYWYNGYRCGESILVYNPWSIVECLRNEGKLIAYWVNTSSNNFIKDLLARSTEEVKKGLESILSGRAIIKTIDEGFTFQNVNMRQDALWSLLFFSGYLTYSEHRLTSDGVYECSLIPPNHEIRTLYRSLTTSIAIAPLHEKERVEMMLQCMIQGDLENFEYLLQHYIINLMSSFDLPESESERSYHMFVLGLLVLLENRYHIRSNRESGYGRYDIMLIPYDLSDPKTPGIIIEFKRAIRQTIEQAVQAALKQINEKKYETELRAQGINTVLIYAIAFEGKNVLVQLQKNNNDL